MAEIKAVLVGDIVYSNSKGAYSLNEKKLFGEKKQDKIQYNLFEALYLVSKNKIKILHNKKTLSFEEALSKFQRKNKNFYQKYLVFENLREKGYVVKDALKFGAEFRVYEKSKTKHAKWIVFVQKESDKINWTEFSSKNRVAHSTKKNLLLAVVGMEGTIVYYEVNWIKP